MTTFADFVRETTTTAGTGDITLVASDGGEYIRFLDVYSAEDTVPYTILNGENRETGLGTIKAGNILERTTPQVTLVSGVLDNTSPSAINLVDGSVVYVGASATFLNIIDTHIDSTANPHSVTKAQIGLSNVDDTSDIDKPVSNATQAVFDALSLADIDAEDITGTPTSIDDLNSILYHVNSAGLAEGGTITDNGNGTIAVAAGECFIRATASSHVPIISASFNAVPSVVLTDAATNYIYIDYNAGSPTVLATTTPTSIDMQTKIAIAIIVREGTDLTIFDVGEDSLDSNASLRKRLFYTEAFKRSDGGSIISSPAGRYVACTQGGFWFGLTQVALPAIDTSVTGTFDYYYFNGSAWISSSSTQLSNTQYNDTSSGLVSLNTNRYCNAWVYSVMDTEGTTHYAVLYGQAQYTSLANASDESPPSTLPPKISGLGVLLGVITVQGGITDAIETRTAFTTTFSSAQVTSHDDLSGIGTNTHTEIDTHIADSTLHFTQASISITASQVSDFDTEVSNNATVAGHTTKLDNITVTQAVDLDTMESDIATNNAKVSNVTTNLGYTASPTDGTVTSSDGANATLPLADDTNAGLLSPAEHIIVNNTSGTNTGDEPSASDTVPGIVELATSAETNTGTDATRAVTPDGLNDWVGSINITTVGDLNSLTLAAISSTINFNTAVSVFAGSVSNDYNPNWPNESTHTSWYNETLNTATRGRTKAFPQDYLIVAESNTVTIYDATDPDLPMWRVRDLTGETISWVTALNGIIYIGTASGVFVDDYINDVMDGSSATYDTTSTIAIQSNAINTLAVTSDNSGNNILYVGSDGGLDRIYKDSVSSCVNDTAGDIVGNIVVIDGYVYATIGGTANSPQVVAFSIYETLSNIITASGGDVRYGGFNYHTTANSDMPIHHEGVDSNVQAISHNAIGTDRGLVQILPNYVSGSEGKGLLCTTTTDSISGYQYGDIRGAWLGSCTSGSLSGTELLVDSSDVYAGDFTQANGALVAPYDEWSAVGATLSVVSNELVVTSTVSQGYAQHTLTCVIGRTYTVTVSTRRGASNESALDVYQVVSDPPSVTTTSTSFVTLSLTFKATQTDPKVLLRTGSTTAAAYFDSVSVVEADPDLSYQNNALATAGTITKSAVNTGCSLQAYSGFSASNYLYQPTSPLSAIDTNDFYVMFWFKTVPNDSIQMIFRSGYHTGTAWSGAGIWAYMPDTGYLFFTISDDGGATTDNVSTSAELKTYDDSQWHFMVCYRNGSNIYLNIDNGNHDESIVITNAAGSLSNSNASLRLGLAQNDSSPADETSLSLFRIGAGYPKASQIEYIYKHERPLFNEGAQCTLTDLSVNSLSFDEHNNMLYALGDTSYIVRQDGHLVNKETVLTGGDTISVNDNLVMVGG